MAESAPTDAELMNYLLGRPLDREIMARISACKDCEVRMRELENRLENEAEDIQGQSAGFGLARPSTSTASRSRTRGKSRSGNRSAG